MSKNITNIFILFGVFIVSAAAFFGIGKGVKSLLSRNNTYPDTGSGVGTVVEEPFHTKSEPSDSGNIGVKVTGKQSLSIADVKVVFNSSIRKYTVTPVLSDTFGVKGVLFTLHRSADASDEPQDSQNESFAKVRQSDKPYYIVASDSRGEYLSSSPVEVTCKPVKLTKASLEDKMNKALEANDFKRFLNPYVGYFDDECAFVNSGAAVGNKGKNGLFTVFQTLRDSKKKIKVSTLDPGNEKNDFKVKKVEFTTV